MTTPKGWPEKRIKGLNAPFNCTVDDWNDAIDACLSVHNALMDQKDKEIVNRGKKCGKCVRWSNLRKTKGG